VEEHISLASEAEATVSAAVESNGPKRSSMTASRLAKTSSRITVCIETSAANIPLMTSMESRGGNVADT